jgi:hypothetical protein
MQIVRLHHRIGDIELTIHESLPFFLLLASVGAILFGIHKSWLRRGVSVGEKRFFRILWIVYGITMVLFLTSELMINFRDIQ